MANIPGMLMEKKIYFSNHKMSHHFHNLFKIHSFTFQVPFTISVDQADQQYCITTCLHREVYSVF